MLWLTGFASIAQHPSVLSTGNWFKFSTTFEGAFKITYDQLRSVGVNPDQIDPRKIKIYTGENGMLPQANSHPRVKDLQEIAIIVSGEEDGRFNREDYILFFGQGPDRYRYDIAKSIFHYENNLFTDKNFYFLTISNENGKRIATRSSIAGSFPVVNQFDDFAFYESEKTNLLKSGRQWFGEQFDATTEATIRFTIPGIEAGSSIRFTSHTMAQSINNSSFKIFFNNVPILDQPIPKIDNTQYGIKGITKIDTITLAANSVNAVQQANQEIKYQFTKASGGLSVGYLDYFLFSFKRRLELYGDQTFFVSSASLANNTSTFEVNSTTNYVIVWDVTDPFSPILQESIREGTKLKFNTASTELRKYGIFSSAKAYTPVFESVVANQNLHGLPTPQFVIITHPVFRAQALRLASHRTSHNNLSVSVVTIDEVFNEYSGGKQDFTAIRDFLRDLYQQPSSRLKNVLLFGRGSYDYKNRVLGNTNFIPVYESRNSLSPLETYSSDDYYTFLEDNEGEWQESPARNHSMDIGIGRIPAKTLEEAKIIVDKLIEYDLDPDSFGAWRKEFLFVADDGDFNLHQSQADQLADNVEAWHPEFTINKFYLDNYEQLERASGQYSTEGYKALDLAIRKGALIVNYTGHGSEQVWMQERLLDFDMISKWKTGAPYPLFVTATCEFGRNDDPFQISSGERTLLQRRGGAIGLVTTARPVFSSTNFALNTAFYEALFAKEGNAYRDLGTICRQTKNKSTAGVSNRNFSLLGDPSMMLAMPQRQVEISEIKTSSGSTELKGLSNATIRGSIKNGSEVNVNFNGVVEAILFDREVFSKTKGDENSPFEYVERTNILFKGKASVANGSFELNFTVPKNFAATAQTGKANFYALSKEGKDAAGASYSFTLNGLEPSPITDNQAPEIKLFIGDTTFRSGGTVPPNTRLIALLADNIGINLSSTNDKGISAIIDNGDRINLSSYYSPESESNGKVEFPFIDLEVGQHTLMVSAYDAHGNKSQSSVDFIVSESDQIRIQKFINFPNPFYESTNLQFTHSREGEDLEATLLIYDIAGQLAMKQTFEIPSSQYQVALTEWMGESSEGIKLKQGIYVARLQVRSLSDGSKNERITKLILLN